MLRHTERQLLRNVIDFPFSRASRTRLRTAAICRPRSPFGTRLSASLVRAVWASLMTARLALRTARLTSAAGLGDVGERPDQAFEARVEARHPVEEGVHARVGRAPREDEMPQLRDGVREGGRVEALLQLADEVAGGEHQLAHLAAVGGELAGVVALDDGDERLEHVAGVVGVRVEEGAEQLGLHGVVLAPVPGTQAAHRADQLHVVVDDRLDGQFEGAYEDDSGVGGIVNGLRPVEGEGFRI